MKQATFVNDEEERRSMFVDIDAADLAGAPPATLDPAPAEVLNRFDGVVPTHVLAVVRVLAARSQFR